MKETDIVQLVRLEASKLGCIIFRNNIGSYKSPKGYYIQYGVCNPGGSDLIGLRKHKGVAQWIALECKMPGKYPTKEQQAFIDMVNSYGGVAGVVRSVEDVRKLLLTDS